MAGLTLSPDPPERSSGPIIGHSENWGGFVACAGNPSGIVCPNASATSGYTSVVGQWTVPSVASTSSVAEYSSTWVGVGGDDLSGSLIQAGTEEDVAPGGAPVFDAWYEMLPASETVVPLTVSPGDSFSVAVTYEGSTGGHQRWAFELEDLTTGVNWGATETCGVDCTPSTFASAEWIEESTTVDGVISQLPAFSRVPFSGAGYTVGSSSSVVELANSTSNLLEIYLANSDYVSGCSNDSITGSSACILVDPGAVVAAGEFFAGYLVNTVGCGEPAVDGCVGLSQSSADLGETITASLWVEAEDSFGPGAATNLALGMSIRTGASTGCSDPTDDAPAQQTPRLASDGTAYYPRPFRVCPGDPVGSYQVEMSVWFVPSGETIGSAGSLMISETGNTTPWLASPTLTVDSPPSVTIEASPAASVDVGQTVTFRSTVTGGSGAYAYAWSVPFGCPPVTTTVDTCEPTSAGQGTSEVGLVVTDTNGGEASATYPFTVYTDPAVSLPTVNRSSVDLGQSVEFQESATGGSGNLTYTWNGLPSGCPYTTATLVACTPNASGNYSVSVTVQDSNGLAVTGASLAFVVHPDPAVATPSANVSAGATGQPVRLSTAGVGGGLPPFTYAWTGLPPGCVDPGNVSAFVCTPSEAGEYTIRLGVTDANGVRSFANLPFSVLGSVIFTESGLPTGTEWWVNLTDGASLHSTATTIQTALANGTYSYALAGPLSRWAPTVRDATFNATGTTESVGVTYVYTYAVVFTRPSGSPNGSAWSVTLTGPDVLNETSTGHPSTTRSANGSALTIYEPNGTYDYAVHLSTQSSYNGTGNVTLRGGDELVTPPSVSSPKPSSWELVVVLVALAAVIAAAVGLWMRRRHRSV